MKTIYNWDKYPEVPLFLDKIEKNTIKEMMSKKNIPVNADEIIQEQLTCLEDFLHVTEVYGYNLSKVLFSLNGLEYFTLANSLLPVQTYEPKIVLNSGLYQTKDLSDESLTIAKEKRRYYLYQGLARHILKFKNDTTLKFSSIYYNDLGAHRHNTQVLVNNGWLLLEEVMVSKLAERFTAYSLNKESSINTVKEEYQHITVLFGLTLNKVGHYHEHSDIIIMYDLLNKCMNGNFSEEVIFEYMSRQAQLTLYESLYIMGLLFNEENHRFPHIKLDTKESKELYIMLYRLLLAETTLEEKEYKGVMPITPQKLNDVEKYKILKLVKENKLLI